MWKQVGTIAFLALALRLPYMGLCLKDPAARSITTDGRDYLCLAHNLRSGDGFSRLHAVGDGGELRRIPELLRTPGYPAFIAASSLLPWIGPDPGPPPTGTPSRRWGEQIQRNGLPWTLTFQVVLQLLMTLGVTITCARWWGPAAGWVAGMLTALDVQGTALACLIATDSLYGICLTGALICAAWATRRGSTAGGILAGVLLGIGSWIRPVSLAVPLVLGAIWWACCRRSSLPRSRAAPAAMLTLSLGLTAAWATRNLICCDTFSLSSAGWYNLLVNRLIAAKEHMEQTPGAELRRRLFEQCGIDPELGIYLPLPAGARACLVEKNKAFLKEAPLANVKLYLYWFGYSVVGPEEWLLMPLGLWERNFRFSQLLRGQAGHPWANVVGLATVGLHLLIVYGLAVRGVWKSSRYLDERAVPVWMALGVSLFLLVTSPLATTGARLRWPVIPGLIMVAAAGFARASERMASNTRQHERG